MNQRQKNQLTEIQRNIEDLMNNYTDIKVFANIIKTNFNLEYIAISKPFVDNNVIEQFIQTYQKKINDLYELVN